jgi:hypothetical protein
MLQIYDMRDPEHPDLVGQWWTPGLWAEGGESPPPPAVNGSETFIHHGIPDGGRLYCGYWDAGVLILDVTDPAAPSVVSQVGWEAGEGHATHTTLPLPGRHLLAVLDEAATYRPACEENPTYLRILDIGDERHPRVLSRWRPDPQVFCQRPGCFGPHNLHENRPGTYKSEDLLFVTFYNAGLQVVDISDPGNPRPYAYYIPAPGPGGNGTWTNDLVVGADGRIFVVDRVTAGLHLLELE